MMWQDPELRTDYAPAEAEHPGDYPFTRGVSAEPKVWIMGQYAGFGTAKESNERFRSLLDAGVTGFSVALDLPSQMGIDSDDPRAVGEVGRVGVAIDSLADIEVLMDGIPLEELSQVRTTANSIGYLWAALFIALAEKRGVHPNEFGMFIQNDVLKEFIARGTQIFPPEASLRLAVDCIEHVARETPRWTPLAMSGYHIRESGSSATQEIAFTFANARAYLNECVRRGVDVDQVAPTLFTFLAITTDVLPEVAKFRAARRVWAKLLKETYGAKDPRSQQLRIFAFTAGSTLTAQQPMNNMVRTSVEATVAALAGVQTMHVSAYDEALGVPTASAATLALRTQQVVAFETGLTQTLDPFAGSYAVEQLTDELESSIWSLMEDIEERGGALEAINSGRFARDLAEAAYRHSQAVESGERVVVGVNRFPADTEPLEVFSIDPGTEAAQADSVRSLRETRDQGAVDAALSRLAEDVAAQRSVMPATIEAIKAYATLGEVVTVLRDELGSWRPSAEF
ncbi:methylmalonyl-CoA mutase family protein [Ornithinimicrobium faecis]|uniref:Methylmalonyl-CoA mutase family protein n=1 Tax=Ornithinimicrobium faecis TaxID=2934158 RepID=A0ABY4YQT2_9MICO|nr:methylmalonyl-CoA mutase family protein [Ornithinimicrobium sp. HY1793]USQ78962.1 methylmalonyl-CoA mutase family protein [Ornithinimicrobium sp. HY1793]